MAADVNDRDDEAPKRRPTRRRPGNRVLEADAILETKTRSTFDDQYVHGLLTPGY